LEKAKVKPFSGVCSKLVNLIAFLFIAYFLANISLPIRNPVNPLELGKSNVSKPDSPIILLSATITEIQNLDSSVSNEPEITEAEPLKSVKLKVAQTKVENTSNKKLKDSETNTDRNKESKNKSDTEPPEVWETIKMRVTAYCPCPICCGEYSDGVTACGHKIRPGDTFVAADRRYSFYTEMLIPGYSNSRPVKVLDRGGAIKGNRLDVFYATHQEALQWGVQYLEVKIRRKNL